MFSTRRGEGIKPAIKGDRNGGRQALRQVVRLRTGRLERQNGRQALESVSIRQSSSPDWSEWRAIPGRSSPKVSTHKPSTNPTEGACPTVPFFRGNPWFSPPAHFYFAVQDRTQLELPGGAFCSTSTSSSTTGGCDHGCLMEKSDG